MVISMGDICDLGQSSYQELIEQQRKPYLQWLKVQGQMNGDTTDSGKPVKLLPFCSCEEPVLSYLEQMGEEDGLCLFYGQDGQLEEYAGAVFASCDNANIIYADEDYVDANGERCQPWFKPEYSPDTLKSFFYYGNIFALRTKWAAKAWKQFMWETGRENDAKVSIYEFLLYASGQTAKIRHIPKILYTNHSTRSLTELPGRGMRLRLVENTNWWRQYYGKELLTKRLVSVIIPSKDNGQVLMRCLETFTEKTEYPHYEFIIVDNGSSEENRQWISLRLRQLEDKTGKTVQYLYQQREFNFAAMCNQGAEAAGGKYLLFLNDDIEIVDGTWLGRMLKEAIQFHTGAVGAKLLYPADSDRQDTTYRIQHVGVTNMGIGPAHKLAGLEDSGNLYHGHNLVNYDMLAVTGACLLVNREKFKQVGNYDEELAIAYNDVELCFRLHETGYLNMVCNEAVLLHHESLSRGQDNTPKRRNRLAGELELLYRKHPKLKGEDPFYSPNLVQWKRDVSYECNYLYPCDRKVSPELCSRWGMPHAHKSRLLRRLTGEYLSMLVIDSVERQGDVLVIDGWYVLREHDNGKLTRWLLLRHDKKHTVYKVPLYPKLREDVEALFAQEENTVRTALAGIHAVIEIQELPEGSYTIGVLAEDGTAGGLGKHGKRIQYAPAGGCYL